LADVERNLGVGVDVFDQRLDFGAKGGFRLACAAVAVELNMSEVRAMSFQQPHRFQGRGVVTGQAEIIAVNMHRMRQLQFIGRAREHLIHAAGS
jgi:hypothetical protein